MVSFAGDRNASINAVCRHCGGSHSIMVAIEDYCSWKQGNGYIQDVLGYLSAGERELLISGTCDNCWRQMYGSPEDEISDEDEVEYMMKRLEDLGE